MHRVLKRNLVIGLAALAVAACAGGAYAATQSSGPSSRQAFLNDVAKRLHVTPQELSSALSGATVDQLQADVQAGRLTQAQANALEQRLKNGGTAPLGPLTPGLAGPRPFLRGGLGVGPLAFGFPGFGLGGAASYLGLTNPQLFQQLQGGKSLAQIAAAKGKTVAGLERAMTAPLKKALDAAVARKAITAAKANQILSRYSARLSQRINQKGLAAPSLKRFFWGGGGPGRFYGPSFVPPSGSAPGKPAAPSAPSAPKLPAQPGVLPQLFQPAPSA